MVLHLVTIEHLGLKSDTLGPLFFLATIEAQVNKIHRKQVALESQIQDNDLIQSQSD